MRLKLGRSATGRGVLISLKLLTIIGISLTSVGQTGANRNPQKTWPTQKNATEPLVYKRLRFEDDSLQALNRFQKYYAIDEHEVRFNVSQVEVASNGTSQENKTKLVEYSFYQNDQVESTNITYDDLVFEAVDAAYLIKVAPYLVQAYDDPEDLRRSSDKQIVSEQRCNKEMDYLMDQVRLVERARLDTSQGLALSTSLNAEVLALLDSFGAEQQGLLLGNIFWPGNWRQCAKRRLFNPDRNNPENAVDFRARYCVAGLRSKRWNQLIENRARELDAMSYFRRDNHRQQYTNFHRLQIGICVPESCDTYVSSRRPDDIHKLAVHKLSEPVRSYELYKFFCLPDETSELRQFEPGAIGFFLFVACWIGMVLVATVVDMIPKKPGRRGSPKTVRQKLVDSFSLLRNVRRILKTESGQKRAAKTSAGAAAHRPERSRLAFVDCTKVVGTVSIVLSHVAFVDSQLDKYMLDFNRVNSLLLHYQFSSALLVDWFFVMSGFLVTYATFSRGLMECITPLAWLGAVVHRYLRLAPLYVLMFWFSQSVMMHTGAGPHWDYGTSNHTIRYTCRQESILHPLTLTSNLFPIFEQCVIPSWFISSDFQFFLVTPWLFTLLHKSPLLGWLAASGAICLSAAARFYKFLSDPHVQALNLIRPNYEQHSRYNYDMFEAYLYPQYRIGAYLLGVLASHYIYMVLSGQWRSSLVAAKPSALDSSAKRTLQGAAEGGRRALYHRLAYYGVHYLSWIIMSQLALASWFLLYTFPRQLEPYAKYIAPAVFATIHLSSAFGFALFLTSMALGRFSTLKRFMSLPIWSILARLSFIVYICQIDLIGWLITASGELRPMDTIETVSLSISVLVLLYVISGVLTPLFELPLATLEQLFVFPLFVTENMVRGMSLGKKEPEPSAGSSGPPAASNYNNASVQTHELGTMNSDESSRLVTAA